MLHQKENNVKALISLLVVVVFCASADASLIGLTKSPPDITSDFISVSYNATTHSFSASGLAEFMDLDGIKPADDRTIQDGDFNIAAVINSAGQATSGTFTVLGTIPEMSANSGVLLTGSLFEFGSGGSLMDFVFTITGGDLASLFGSKVGVNLASNGGFAGSFAGNFQNTGSGVSDMFSVPEPVTLSLLLAAAPIALLRRLRRGQG